MQNTFTESLAYLEDIMRKTFVLDEIQTQLYCILGVCRQANIKPTLTHLYYFFNHAFRAAPEEQSISTNDLKTILDSMTKNDIIHMAHAYPNKTIAIYYLPSDGSRNIHLNAKAKNFINQKGNRSLITNTILNTAPTFKAKPPEKPVFESPPWCRVS